MFPFNNKRNQTFGSLIFILTGLLMIIIKPVTNIIESIKLDSFFTGIILLFLGLFYLIEAQ